MPLFNDLKRIFFGAKSVAKHQASRAGEKAREAGDELAEQGDELLDLTRRAAGEFVARAPEFIDRGKHALSDLGDAVWKEEPAEDELTDTPPAPAGNRKAKDIIDEELTFGNLNLTPEADAPKSGSVDFEADLLESEPPSPKPPSAFRQAADAGLDAAAQAGLKAKKVAEDVGDDFLNRAAETGARLKGKADAFIEHANREAERMKAEEAAQQAKAAAEQAAARARAFDNREGERDDAKSTLSGTDSFFDRADRFARGDYHNEGGKDMRILDDPDYQPRKKGDRIAGFEDHDGDGDSLIDDAEIEED
ncbi:ElaB/YqjD/DUF883 family membrane-anchored ribosome-binding protein [Lewinella marina]|uniref:Uncharacterized protein n=1 Tax=Neolewinella marina TaxID=438751 RepID=A0A2G0CF91_9BACT|nr:hypothetical protein [Neolewinella marina]NJB85738.1 ElaB/YqjD/DUF883 family membrane-anchored ribosome-binding protein [Neolewinella marina]PHK98587.1 hypothetical protein CGL56_08930 [Neolewinella marina]